MIKKVLFSLLCMCAVFVCHAQTQFTTDVPVLDGEKWWGGMVGQGSQMPFAASTGLYDLAARNYNNQNVPLLLSSKGRYVWSDRPFAFQMKEGRLCITSQYEEVNVTEAGHCLKDAYLAASKTHFPPSGKLPDPLFFSMPQYNTWIELLYNQNQADILLYADNIRKHEFPVGVFMVDDNWQKYYGNFEFKPERFPDPKGMIEQLHSQGFRIMLWICPFVSPDSPEFRELQSKGYLIKRKGTNTPAIIPWWNGYSACYDMSNPEAVEYFKRQLRKMQQEYGIDGFKFDAGDIEHYNDPSLSFHDVEATSVDMCEYWAKVGLDFPFNEYRAGWKMGNQPLVQRLGDKYYSWEATNLLIPDMIAAGLMGYAYACPDMIGGGQAACFMGKDQSHMDQELIVRSCQVHALMPMMQFSVAPWRILDAGHLAICRKFARLHESMGSYILSQARASSLTGEPIVRHMEYAYPHQGFIDCKDQFMLGDSILVAPVMSREHIRKVKLPKGRWMDDLGKKHKGGKTITVDVPLDRLPWFRKLD